MTPPLHNNNSESTTLIRFWRMSVIFGCCLILWGLHSDSPMQFLVQFPLLVTAWCWTWSEKYQRFILFTFLFVTILFALNWGDLDRFLTSRLLVASCAIVMISTLLKKLEFKHEAIAGSDPLTGLMNQLRFVEIVDEHLKSTNPEHQLCAIVFLDCDSFKTLNDTFGHLIGDEHLINAAKKIHSCLQPGEFAARWGGDEFVLFLKVESEESMIHRMKSLQHDLSKKEAALKDAATWSIGIAIERGQGDAREIINAADQAMYVAKRRGHGQIHVSKMAASEYSEFA